MKIVYLTRAPFGLMGTGASYMIPSIVSKTHDVVVISPEAKKSEKDKIIFYNTNIAKINITNSSNITRRANELIEPISELKPDIIHIFSHPGCFIYPKILSRYKIKTKWYLDIRSHIFSQDKLNHWTERVKNTFVQRRFNYISATALDSYKSYIGYPFREFNWSPIGVDINAFDKGISDKFNDSNKIFKFIFVGSIAKVRQLHVLINGVIDYLHRYEKNIILDIYGLGNALQDLKLLVKESGFSDHIQFKGILPFNMLAKAMPFYHAGLVYLPKDKFDYAPALKRLEYAAAKIDIIESDTRWNLENKEGFKVFQFRNDPISIANTIYKYCKNYSINGRAEYNYERVKLFDWSFIVNNKILPVYDLLLQS